MSGVFSTMMPAFSHGRILGLHLHLCPLAQSLTSILASVLPTEASFATT